MTPKERYLAAIRHELPDRLPLDSLGIDSLGAVADALSVPRSEEAWREVCDRLGIDSRSLDAPYVGAPRLAPDGTPLSFWGTARERYGAQRDYPISPDASLGEIERYPWPSTRDFDYADLAAKARRWGDRYAVYGPQWHPLFCQACDLLGMEEAMMALAAQPEVFEAIVERVFQFVYEHCQKVLEAGGENMPILVITDDFATQRGMMISPADWRRVLKPRYAKLTALAKERGKYVLMHSCGNILEVLQDLIDIGVDVWQTVQLHTLGIGPEELKRRFGRHLTFFGGVNTQRLPFMTPDQVRQEVRRCIQALGPGGGYIASPDHSLKPDVPVANILALYETAREFRGEGYTS